MCTLSLCKVSELDRLWIVDRSWIDRGLIEGIPLVQLVGTSSRLTTTAEHTESVQQTVESKAHNGEVTMVKFTSLVSS